MNAQHVGSSKYERALRPWLMAAIGLCLSALSGCERPPERRGDALKPDERIISTPIKKPVVIRTWMLPTLYRGLSILFRYRQARPRS
jgi:hypothetical protein